MIIRLNRFRPRGSIVYAIQVTEENMQAVATWCGAHVVFTDIQAQHQAIQFPGLAFAMRGDWVLKKHNGHFLIMTDALFHTEYVQDSYGGEYSE
jgi:hypothetical protein